MTTSRRASFGFGLLGGAAALALHGGYGYLTKPGGRIAESFAESRDAESPLAAHFQNSPDSPAADAVAEAAAEPYSIQLTQFGTPRLGRPATATPRTAVLPPQGPPVAAPNEPLPPDLTEEERNAVEVYERCNRSAVNISTKTGKPEGFFAADGGSEGAGSGVVIDKAGHVLTNFHVIEGADKVTVTLYDGEAREAIFVGADPVNDTAVLRVNAPPENLYPVAFGDSARLRVGMRVFAIGNPFGLERTLTTGVVSSLNRTLKIRNNRTVRSIIQVDAAINPGSSGGPLLDTRGRLIGMNTAIASTNGQSAGVGFAIPVNLIARIVPQVIAHGKVLRPDPGIARVYETDRGLQVAALVPGGPAEAAGLRGPAVVRKRRGPFLTESLDRSAADVIVAVDDVPVKTADDFLDHVERKQPGDVIRLDLLRAGQPDAVEIRLRAGE